MSAAAPEPAPFARRTECPQCGTPDFTIVSPSIPEIHRCHGCGLAYRLDPIHPLDTPQRDAAKLAAIDASRDELFDDMLARLGTPEQDGRLVDIGASSGYFVERATSIGWRAIGIEFGRSLAAMAGEQGRRVIVGDGQALPLRSHSAAAVTLWDAIDQFDRPGDAVAEAARILRPGGTLWLRVRNGRAHRFMRSRSWLPARLSVLPNNMYSPAVLRGILDAAGFEDVRVAVSPTSTGDPYAAMERSPGTFLLRAAKALWDRLAAAVALLSGGRLIISPSIAALATRRAAPPAHTDG